MPRHPADAVVKVAWSSEPCIGDTDRRFLRDVGGDLGPFADPVVLEAWLATHGRVRSVLIGRAVAEAGLVGIIVLCLRPGDPHRWRLWGDGVDTGVVAIAPGHEVDCWSAWLAADRVAERGLLLRNLANGHRVGEGLGRASRALGIPVELVDARSMPHVDLRGGIDAWLAGRTRSQRRQFRRSRVRFAELADRTLHEHDDRVGVAAATDEFFDLHGRRFRASGRSSQYDDPIERAFLAHMTTGLADGGRLRAFVVRSAGVAVAVDLVVTGDTTWYSLNGGWDPDLAAHHLGTGLLLHEIECAAAAGMRRFSLLDGEEPYKRRYATGAARLASWSVPARSCITESP
jgi:CelD/BcsL family acetyltransferase involved in cellulose biosynthesis